jgi:hypothetical protein
MESVDRKSASASVVVQEPNEKSYDRSSKIPGLFRIAHSLLFYSLKLRKYSLNAISLK